MNQTSNIVPLPKITRPAIRAAIGIFLFVIGLQAWMNLGLLIWGRNYQWLALLIILCLSAIPPVARHVSQALDAISRWTGRHRNLIALLIFFAATAFLYHCAIFEGIPLFPQWEDEFVYLIQIHMMAHGHLWMPHHPLARYFDSLYLITGHAYAGMYFPGTAVLLAPTIWLGLPKYAGPLIIAGISAALIFRVVVEFLDDGLLGLLAALILVSLFGFRMISTLVLSQGPMLMLGLLMVLAYLRWRNSNRSNRWLIILSITMGLAAITRPIDAFCYAAIIAVAMILDLRRQPFAAWIKTASILLPIVFAFLTIQLVFNIGVTGHWNRTPYGDYLGREFPGIALEFSPPPTDVKPESDLPQIHQFYRDFVRPVWAAHQKGELISTFFHVRVPLLWDYGFPHPFFWLLIPFSFLSLFKKRSWVLWGVLPLSMLIYTAWTFLPYYIVPFLPPIILITVLAVPSAVSLFPRFSHHVQCAVVLSIVVLCILSWPQLDRMVYDTTFHSFELEEINQNLAQIHSPAIVLFHYHNGDIVNGRVVVNSVEVEPVYNSDVAWPDDAPIIRAQDRNTDIASLGTPSDQNRALYLYYAKIDPHRTVYLYDRLFPVFKCRLRPLGSVADLAAKTAPKKEP